MGDQMLREAAERIAGPHKRRAGKGWMVRCPGHDDDVPSLSLSRGDTRDILIHCFAGCRFEDLAPIIEGMGVVLDSGAQVAPRERGRGTTGRDERHTSEWRWAGPQREPAAVELLDPEQGRRPVAVWAYRTGDGRVAGYVARYEDSRGAKAIRPWSWWRRGSEGEARLLCKAPPKGERPPYQADRIAAGDGRVVVVCEGEKAADAAQALLPECIGSCWQGGVDAVRHTRWEGLRGRTVVLVPDNDEAGEKGMREAWGVLERAGAHVSLESAARIGGRAVHEGGDLADLEAAGVGAGDVDKVRARLPRGHPLRRRG